MQVVFTSKCHNRRKILKICFCFNIHFAGAHSATAYRKLMGKIELFNKLCYFSLLAIWAILFSSNLPYTYVRYYVLDVGKESFFLFYPTWFVLVVYAINSNEMKLIRR